MSLYWLRDKELQKKIKTFLEKGTSNFADYFTKHHSTKYHREVRRKYVLDKTPMLTMPISSANQVSILNRKNSRIFPKRMSQKSSTYPKSTRVCYSSNIPPISNLNQVTIVYDVTFIICLLVCLTNVYYVIVVRLTDMSAQV